MALTPRPGILGIAPYVGGTSKLAGFSKAIKLSSNEGAFGPSPKAVEAVSLAAQTMHRYPDGQASVLRGKIGEKFGLDPARIVCGAGSDELLQLLVKGYAGPGDEVVYSRYGFLVYPLAAMAAGATPVVAEEDDLTASVDNLLAAVTDKTRILFITNPNNPTGTYLPASEIKRLKDGLPSNALLVIDAAYAEFCDRDDYTSGFELVEGAENVVVTRTFSKLYALGGLRLGWAYCPAGVADILNRIRGPFNVSSPALEAGVASLADEEFLSMSISHNSLWRDRLTAALEGAGLLVTPSSGNFILVHFPKEPGRDAAAADEFLKSRGVIVRSVASYGLPQCLRITIGLASEMETVIAALSEFMGRK